MLRAACSGLQRRCARPGLSSRSRRRTLACRTGRRAAAPQPQRILTAASNVWCPPVRGPIRLARGPRAGGLCDQSSAEECVHLVYQRGFNLLISVSGHRSWCPKLLPQIGRLGRLTGHPAAQRLPKSGHLLDKVT